MENTYTNQEIRPQNYMTLAIISTILGCCGCSGLGFVVGLVGIYFASQVNPRFNAGDVDGANKNSKTAKILSFVALGMFAFSLIASAVMMIFYPEYWNEQMEATQQMMEQMGLPQE